LDAKQRILATAAVLLVALTVVLSLAVFGPPIDWGKPFRLSSAGIGGPTSGTLLRPDENAELLYTLAQRYDRQGDHAYAAALARRITYVDPRHVNARKFLASAALRRKDYEEARRWCDEALRINPADVSARLGLATAYRGLGRKEEARTTLKSIIKDTRYSALERGTAQAALNELKDTPAAPAIAR
jgi:tetratricopeptide (TPR) repeat protein